MLTIIALAVSLTSCEDVPEPYAIPSDGGGDTPSVEIEAEGDGTLENPYNVAAANKVAALLATGEESEGNIYIKGKITSIKEQYSTQYGNGTFYISDDEAASNKFYIYRAYYLGNKKFTSNDTEVKVGDEVVIYGKIVNYNGTLETAQNSAYLYSLNGQTENGGGGNEKPSDEVLSPVNGVFINESFASDFGVFSAQTVEGLPWVIDFSTAKATGYDNSTKTTTPSKAYLVSMPMDMTTTNAATISFDYILRYFTNYGESKPGVEDKVLITADYTGDPTTTTWTDITGTLTEGSDWSTFYSYKADIPAAFIGKGKVVVALYYACESNSATWEVKNFKVAQASNGGDNPGGEVTGNSITMVASELGFDDAEDVTVLTLSDGTTITFDGGGNNNTPKYYNTGTAIRMYPKNSMTVSSTKTISSITMVCDEYNSIIYNASGDISTSNGTIKTDGVNVIVSGIGSNSATLTNISSQKGATSQIRMESLTITYAE